MAHDRKIQPNDNRQNKTNAKNIKSNVIQWTRCSEVLTTTGYIRGKLVQGEGLQYYSYQGIPYAEKPTGNLRFRPPVPKNPWPGVLDATTEGCVCPQPEGNYKQDQMSDDCLFVNIYAPANSSELLPVLAYVHGGEFKSLSGNSDIIYDPELLLERDMIVVTMNYRLGALGFLSLDIEAASGNAGIKDVLVALEWIKSNIGRFGGDTNRITLGGNSAGAVLVHYLTLTSKSTDLFQHAILISGSALGYRFLALHAKENALALGQELNLTTNDTNDLLQQLRKANAFDIVEAQENMGKNNIRNGLRPFAPFVPCIEIEYPDAVITEHPILIIKAGIPQNVPIFAGFNSKEGIKMLPAIRTDPSLMNVLNENFELCIPTNIQYPYTSYESEELGRSIHTFYFDDADVSNSTLENFVELARDTQFSYAVDSWIRLHKERKDSKALYYYVLDFDGELNWFKITNNVDFPGTSHADELGYIFKTKATKEKLNDLDSPSQRMLHIMVTLLSNFIKFGNPTPEPNIIDGINWPECGRDRNHIILSDSPQVKYEPPLLGKLQFWYQVYHQYQQYKKNDGLLESKIIP